MSAELEARRTAAAAVLADFRRGVEAGNAAADYGDAVTWALRLGAELRSLIEVTAPEIDQVAQIRLVLDSFDWEHDDRQYALEQIDDIMRGDR